MLSFLLIIFILNMMLTTEHLFDKILKYIYGYNIDSNHYEMCYNTSV